MPKPDENFGAAKKIANPKPMISHQTPGSDPESDGCDEGLTGIGEINEKVKFQFPQSNEKIRMSNVMKQEDSKEHASWDFGSN